MDQTVVVQDADKDVLEFLKLALELDGFRVKAVLHCDEEVLEIIDKTRPHVVMLDYKLDGEACIEICQRVKAKYPHLPVIALSCNVNIHEKYAQAGFDAYIEKPFDLNLLYRIIHKNLPASSIGIDKE